MPVLKTIKYLAASLERFLIYRVFSLNDTPHRLALGVAIGMFVAWTPTIGIQMALTVGLCWLFGANKLVGVPCAWLSNPATIIPVYGPNYFVGCWLLGKNPDGWNKVVEAIRFQGSLYERILEWFYVTRSIFWELWIGSFVVAMVLGILTYFIMYRMIIVYRTQKKHLLDIVHQHRIHKAEQKTGENLVERNGETKE